MVKCVCDKSIDKIPSWLTSVKVDFVCSNCPRRQVKTISQLHAEQTAAASKVNEPANLDTDPEPEELDD